MKKKNKTTYEEFIENKKQKKLLGKEYRELLISELLLAAMKEEPFQLENLHLKPKSPLQLFKA